jgi:hypothetical protein
LGTYFCPPGTVPIPATDSFGNPLLDDFGSPLYRCLGIGGDIGLPVLITVPIPPPGYTPVGAPPPATTSTPPPAIAANPVRQRQPGAPSVPYTPPGRISLFPGPFGGVSSSQPVVPTSTSTSESQTSIAGGAVAIANASINQSITVMNQDVTPLADAVNSAINSAVQDAATTAQDTTNQITGSLNTFSTSLFDWAKSIGTWLKDHIVSILDDIKNGVIKVADTVYNVISGALDKVATFYKDTLEPILSKIATSVKNIADFYEQHIKPILDAVSTAINTIQKAITAIEADLKSGLQGILQLPTDLANAVSGIDAALIRAGRALKVHKADDADFYYVTADGKGFADHIKSLGAALTGLGVAPQKTTFSPGHESLSEPTLAQELPKLLDAMNTIIFDIAKGLKNIALDPAKLGETLGIGLAAFWAGLIEPLELLLALWEIMKAPLGVIGELAEERVREVTQLTKLDGGTLAAAWQRDFITSDAMDEELATQGYNKQRSELLRRLKTYVEDPATLVDYRYRGIVTDDDFASGLKDVGFTPAQRAALLEGSTRLLDVTTALDAWRREKMDEATVDEIIAVNRFTTAQGELLKNLNFSGPDYQSAYRAYLERRMLERIGLPTPVEDTIPAEVHDAGHHQGLNDAAILAQWTSQVNSLPSTLWLALYWRGQASLEELRNALFRDRVPEDLWTNWIDSQRPLIPFRTIPAMVAAGLITEAEAISRLEKHGYSLPDAVLLMQYASRGSKKAKATTATTQHDLSLAQAKTAYDDGIITVDQYKEILLAHGLDSNAVAIEVKLTQISQETKARKQIGIDIVDEYQAGLIDQQTALQQLASSGYTIAEQAAVQKKLKAANSVKAKTPSEAELRAMTKHAVISTDDYYNSLIVIGYSTTWAQRFRDLYFPVDTSQPAAALAGG